MKRLLVATAILAGVIGLCSWSIWVQQHTVSDLIDEVKQVRTQYYDGHTDASLQTAEQLVKEFPKRTKLLQWFVGHHTLHTIHQSITVLPIMLEHHDYHGFAVKLEECMLDLKRLKEKGLPNLKNIL